MSEPAVQPEHSRRRKRILLYMGLALVSVLLAVGLWLAAQPAAPPLQGEVDAASVNVATKALARLETVRVREGDRVRAGAVLATLSSPEIANGQQQAEAALDSARAAQTLADEGVRPEDLTSLKATWQAAQAAADLAAKTSMRADHLYAEGVIAAVKAVGLKVPLVVRLEGTNVEEGKKIIRESGLNVLPADDLDDAAQKIVNAVKGK